MKEFSFETVVTMKEYNRKKWWIDGNIVKAVRIHADNLPSALQQYREIVQEESGISISDNAIRNKSEMYMDTPNGTQQCGYVITGKYEFYDDNWRNSFQYVDLWVNIAVVTNPFEMEV